MGPGAHVCGHSEGGSTIGISSSSSSSSSSTSSSKCVVGSIAVGVLLIVIVEK